MAEKHIDVAAKFIGVESIEEVANHIGSVPISAPLSLLSVEPEVARLLVEAIDNLRRAYMLSNEGLACDCMHNAAVEIRKALRGVGF